MIKTTTKYKDKEFEIYFDEQKEVWRNSELALDDSSLKGLKKKIEHSCDKKDRLQKQKLKRVLCLYGFDIENARFREGEVASVIRDYSWRHELEFSAWVSFPELGTRSKEQVIYLYEKDDEIAKLLLDLKKVKDEIAIWKENHQFTPEKLIKELGYSSEYAKEEFGIDLEKLDEKDK